MSTGWEPDWDAFWQAAAQTAEQVLVELEARVDEALQSWEEPLLDLLIWLDGTTEAVTQPLHQTLDPILEERPACVGCRNYHGQIYGDTLLVCAMHPYGWSEGECPDWESAWTN
ncbi:MAG: hypothetical protein IGQ88_06525 [Gloeomargaritaceae cyanobacterium C42_A2020_066]|nr:hypothetical protein [Gloeomargaritaceae cyanobacterium C42_A2020_066]